MTEQQTWTVYTQHMCVEDVCKEWGLLLGGMKQCDLLPWWARGALLQAAEPTAVAIAPWGAGGGRRGGLGAVTANRAQAPRLPIQWGLKWAHTHTHTHTHTSSHSSI